MNHAPPAPSRAPPTQAAIDAAFGLAAMLDALCAFLATHLLLRLLARPLRTALCAAADELRRNATTPTPTAARPLAASQPAPAIRARLLCDGCDTPARRAPRRIPAAQHPRPSRRPTAPAPRPTGRCARPLQCPVRPGSRPVARA